LFCFGFLFSCFWWFVLADLLNRIARNQLWFLWAYFDSLDWPDCGVILYISRIVQTIQPNQQRLKHPVNQFLTSFWSQYSSECEKYH
jgi:hypothetical protein